MSPIALDVAHLFAGSLVLVSFMLLYQDRMTGLINIFALHALVVSLSVAWQANIQQAPHLYITAAIALIEAASYLKLLLYVSVISCVFFPWGVAAAGQGPAAYLEAMVAYVLKLAIAGFALAVFETAIAKMRVFRVSDFLGAALMLGFLATLLLFVSRVA